MHFIRKNLEVEPSMEKLLYPKALWCQMWQNAILALTEFNYSIKRLCKHYIYFYEQAHVV